MHEASLALSLLDLIAETARRERAERVLSATVEIGALSPVEPEALAFAFEAAKRDQPRATATRLIIQHTEGFAQCMACGEDVRLKNRGEACPQCGSFRLLVTAGDEMRLKEVEVA